MAETKPVNTVLMMGKTGSGKGTQSKLLADRLGFKVFSSGDKFREIRLRQDWLGARVREDYDQGLLMPHWYASYLFEEAFFNTPPEQGIIFEGSGRKKPEAELFNEVATWLRREYVVFNIIVTDDEVVRRSKGRGRSDGLDEESKIRNRLKEYEIHTGPAIEYFRSLGRVIDIDGMPAAEAIHEDIVKKLSEYGN